MKEPEPQRCTIETAPRLIEAVITLEDQTGKVSRTDSLLLPEQFRNCPIANALIADLINAENAQRKSNEKYTRLLRHRRLLEFCEHKYKSESSIPLAVFVDYSVFLRGQGLVESSACGYMSCYRTALNSRIAALQENAGDSETLNFLSRVVSTIPSFSNHPGRPKPSLSEICKTEHTDELENVRSTIHFCCTLLKLINEQRQSLLSIPAVTNCLNAMIDDSNGDFNQLRFGSHITKRSTLYSPLALAILESDDLSLKERLLLNRQSWAAESTRQESTIDLRSLNEQIEKGLYKTGSLNISTENRDNILNFAGIDYLSLVKPTQAEIICFSWLLATDRVQHTGVMKMNIDDLHISPNKASATYIKNRSPIRDREVPMHSSGSLQYTAYKEFKSLAERFAQLYPSESRRLLDMPSNANLQHLLCLPYRPIIFAAHRHTYLHKKMLLRDKNISTFAEIIKTVSDNNELFYKNKSSKEHNRQTISISAIAQSRAILDEDQPAPQNEAYEKYSASIVGADATAHSPCIKEVKYKHASLTKYRLDKRASFSQSVGRLMVEDARKVQKAIQDVKFLSLKELKKLLGWAKPSEDESIFQEFDSLLHQANEAGYSITPLGEFSLQGDTFIITTPISAALLLDYKRECENLLQENLNMTKDRAIAILMKAAYVDGVLNNFDTRTVSDGLKILTNNPFPKPMVF